MAFRRKADRFIDDAYNAIACAEMMLMHSFTDEDKAKHGAELSQAQRYLIRAVSARNAWDAAEHDDYEEYPFVPATDQDDLFQNSD